MSICKNSINSIKSGNFFKKIANLYLKVGQSGDIILLPYYSGENDMLCGKSFHTMDAKNRIIIPQTYRAEIGDTVYITVGYDSNLFIISGENFNTLAQKVMSVPETSVESREFRRNFFGNAVPCELDKSGRIVLPQILIKHANIEKDVVIIGVYDKLELWSLQSYEKYTASESETKTNQVLEKMAARGV